MYPLLRFLSKLLRLLRLGFHKMGIVFLKVGLLPSTSSSGPTLILLSTIWVLRWQRCWPCSPESWPSKQPSRTTQSNSQYKFCFLFEKKGLWANSFLIEVLMKPELFIFGTWLVSVIVLAKWQHNQWLILNLYQENFKGLDSWDRDCFSIKKELICKMCPD